MMNVSKIVTISLCTLFITACGDNPFNEFEFVDLIERVVFISI